jgi:hypothetical protein
LQLGPKAKEFLTNRPSFVLTIRSAKKGVGARSKKVLQPSVLSPTISVRKKRTRLEPADDPVEPFPPDDAEANLDDIEFEPEPREPSPPPRTQARRLRASPSIQVVENPPENALDSNQECFKALCALRTQVRAFCIRCSRRAQIMFILVRSGASLRSTGHPC